jgi:hypothetical protein
MVAVVAASAFVGASCSNDAEPQPLTDEQASALSQVLTRNYDAGGAAVVATVPYGPESNLRFDGVVDWVEHGGLGRLVTEVDGRDPERTEVAWTESEVAVRPEGGGADDWTFRPADPDTVPLDRVIALVVASAGPERDNPLLVAQSDARWLRTDSVDVAGDDVEVDVFDSGGRLEYWIGVDDGLLYRLDADIDGFEGTTTIEYRDHGPVQLDR